MKALRIIQHRPRGNRHHVLTEADVRVVLERLPASLSQKLNAIHLNDRSMGRRSLGDVRRGQDELALCALPRGLRLSSASRRGQSPAEFGALRGCQWPRLAVRRFMLYDVLLHELGHLQVINARARTPRRSYAGETRAEQFADRWRRVLWAQPFNHLDPVHNPPSPEETAALRAGWVASHRDYKQAVRAENVYCYEQAVFLLERAVERDPQHAIAPERPGTLTYAGLGTRQSTTGAVRILRAAIARDPTLFDAHLYLGLALAREDHRPEARRCLEQAMRLDSDPPLAMSAYADVLADWGHFAEAEALFRTAVRRAPHCTLAIRNYGRTLIRDRQPGVARNLRRAIALFDRAVALDPSDPESRDCLGDVLTCLDDQLERGISLSEPR